LVIPHEPLKEARAEYSTRRRGRADYVNRADREAKEELLLIVIRRSPAASYG